MNNQIDKSFNTKIKSSYFKPKYWGAWLAILFLGLLAYIPKFIKNPIAWFLSSILCKFNIKFKRKVLLNLTKTFPDYSKEKIELIYKDFLRIGFKCIFGYGETFFRSQKYIKNNFSVVGVNYYEKAIALGKPIIFLAPHAWTIDRGGLFLSASGLTMCTMMHTSKNEVFDWFMNSMRLKFGGKVFERSAGIKSIIRSLKEGYSCFYLPDQDLSRANAIFVKFFGTQKSSLTVLPKLANLSKATILPMFCCYNEELDKYEVVFLPHFENYPTSDLEKDVRRMNEAIEELIRSREKQYMWFLKIYKHQTDNSDVYKNL